MKLSTIWKKIIAITVTAISIILLVIYLAGVSFYKEHFFPNTVINGMQFGKSDAESVSELLGRESLQYSLKVLGRDLQTKEKTELFELSAEDIALVSSVSKKDVTELLQKQNPFLWLFCLGGVKEYHISGKLTYDSEMLDIYLDRQTAFDENSTVLPQDAYIQGYSEEENAFILVPEVLGTRLDETAAREVIEAAVTEGAESISMEDTGCYLEPVVIASEGGLRENVEQANQWLQTKIRYSWNTQEVFLDVNQIKEWVVLQDGVLNLNRDAVEDFVRQNADLYDTYGKTRNFRTTLGYDLALPSGAFGWKTDVEAETAALLDLIKKGSVCDREPVYAHKAPQKGANDIGNSYVEADMTHQHLYLYKSGMLVLETDFVSGDVSKTYNTPEGVFGITYKTTNATLRGGDYAEQVSYWMPYHGNYGMHDATWREEFGGDIYLTNGSHGCINLPLEKAGEIYQQVSEGFPVICYNYPPGVLPEQDYDVSDDEDD